jgi:aromatic ring-opening dioxygenase catalytic subunit (LigB family)
MTYYSSVSFLYMGIGSEESQKMGERIAYFEKASELLIASGKLTKNLDSDVVRHQEYN